MKYSLTIIFMLLFRFSSFAQQKIVRVGQDTPEVIRSFEIHMLKYLDSANYIFVYGVADSMQHGRITGIDDQGIVRLELNLVHGIFDGVQKYYHDNGRLKQMATFDSGLFEGQHVYYDSSGNQLFANNYQDGMLEGYSEVYWPNGNVSSRQFFHHNQLISEEFFDDEGNVEEGVSMIDLNVDYSCLEYHQKKYSDLHVKSFRKKLTMHLVVDSIVFFDRKDTNRLVYTASLTGESEMIRLNDTLYIKIFVDRKERYGNKLYSMSWEYFVKNEACFRFLATGMERMLAYNSSESLTTGGNGQGIGRQGEPGYFMIYYRYKVY